MSTCKLTATTRGKTVQFELRPGRPITLGRSNHCTVPVHDPKMSREHCRLEFVDGKLLVTDLGSSHGLMLRGENRSEFELEIGDGFHAGQTFVRFEAQEADSAAAGATEPQPPGATARVEQPDAAPAAVAWDEEPEEAGEPEEQYPTIGAHGPVSPGARRRRSRRRAPEGSGIIVQVLGQVILYVMILVTGVAVLLALKHRNPDWDIYRLLDWLRPPK
jgi:hypothetical protein